MSFKIRMGFVGISRSSEYLKNFQCNSSAKIIDVCDVVKERAEQTAADHGAQAYIDYE